MALNVQRRQMTDPRSRLGYGMVQEGLSTAPVQHWTQGAARLANALAGTYLMNEAENDQMAANEALMGGYTAQPWVNPDTGETVGDAGGISGARYAVSKLGSNPAANDLMSALLGEEMQRDYRRELTADERAYQEGLTQDERDYRKSILADEREYNAPLREAQLEAALLGNEANRLSIDTERRGPAPQIEVINGRIVAINPRAGTATEIGNYSTQPRPLTPEERPKWGIPATDRTPYYMNDQGVPTAIGKGGQTINVGSEVGTIPQGYELVTNPDTGARSMAPIPGGPADTSKSTAVAEEQQQRYGNIVLEDIARARNVMSGATLPTTGIIGQGLSQVGGTAARDLKGLTDTIRANIGFDRLQAMRESSPTGGALGQVTERELAFLQATLGNLEQSQSEQQFTENLNRLESIYRGILDKASAYPNAGQYGFDAPRNGQPSTGNTTSAGVKWKIVQ